ncbi:MmgE/PrpD family protein [Roseomonas sp. AR75]|uniref:MmgE/PrpD family protein n=1 Tax=Roseomonas sp. AR75 TaxID=2562311 RepID=UPI0010BF9074|nr:MmgE/PrpD family protein [Roseomonas sp. AR75]
MPDEGGQARDSLTASLGRFAAALRFEHLPEAAIARAKANMLDAIGCILAGVNTADATPVRAVVAADGGAAEALLFGTTLRLPPAAAALANGAAGHALDYDDSSPPMIGHPSVPLVSAIFALAARNGAGGAQAVTAYVAGLEAAARLGRNMNPSHYAAGWHATATLGTLAATVGAAKLLGLDARGVRMAVGIGASSAAGIRRNFGSAVKPLHAGLAARNGVVAALLAANGLVADADALDGERGFVHVFGGADRPDLSALRYDDGALLEVVASGVGIKRYSCCGCTHSALDALLALRAAHAPDPDAVDSIHCTMNALVPDILVHHRPETPAQAKFSMEYCLAAALLDGDCGIAQFKLDRVTRADVQALLRRVTTAVDPAIAYRNGVYPGTVTIRLKDGRELVGRAEEAKGHPDFPLSLDELRTKFLDCATQTIPLPQAEAAFAALAALETAPRLNDIAALLEG